MKASEKLNEIVYEAFRGNDVLVNLEDIEYHSALKVGEWIWKKSQQGNLTDYWGKKPGGAGGMWLQQLGAIAERGVAKALDLYWPGLINTFKNPDLSHNIEVRLIGVDHYGLRVRNSDNDTRRIVGIVIPKGKERCPYRIPGWITAGEAKRVEWEMNPYEGRPMYCVPQKSLRPLSELKEIILREKLEQLNSDRGTNKE